MPLFDSIMFKLRRMDATAQTPQEKLLCVIAADIMADWEAHRDKEKVWTKPGGGGGAVKYKMHNGYVLMYNFNDGDLVVELPDPGGWVAAKRKKYSFSPHYKLLFTLVFTQIIEDISYQAYKAQQSKREKSNTQNSYWMPPPPSGTKPPPYHPKRKLYDSLQATVKLRRAALGNLSKTNDTYALLANELAVVERKAAEMKTKYKL